MEKFEINASLKCLVFYDKEVQSYVSCIPALNIGSQGETMDKAKEAIKDALKGYLIVSHKNNKDKWGRRHKNGS